MFVIRFAIYFTLSFLVLSVPFKGKTVFGHLHLKASPITEEILGEVGERVVEAVEMGLNFGKRLFKNSTPQSSPIQSDRVKVSSRAPKAKRLKRKGDVNELGKNPEDNYTNEERNLLKKILDESL